MTAAPGAAVRLVGASARLGLLVCLLAAIAAAQWVRADAGTPITLAAGALLLCALFAGTLAGELGLPRLSGYLLIGIVIGPHGLDFIPREGVAGLDLVKGLAVSLIAFTAGAELRLAFVRRAGLRVLGLAGALSGAVFATSAGALLALRPFLPFLRDLPLSQAVALAALAATVMVSFSPTVTIAIIQETRARGPLAELLMALVILGDLVVMLAFAVAAGWARASFGGPLDVAGLAGGVGWELFGSLAIGAAAGLGTTLYLRWVDRELPIFVCAVAFASAELGAELHLSPLLLSLAAGAAVVNLDPAQCAKLKGALERASMPVLALFFAGAGAGLNLSALRVVGPVALALGALRASTIYGTTWLFDRGEPRSSSRFAWMGLVSQAGVTIGLAALVRRTFPAGGAEIEALVLALVALNQLVGPVLTRKALDRAGEI